MGFQAARPDARAVYLTERYGVPVRFPEQGRAISLIRREPFASYSFPKWVVLFWKPNTHKMLQNGLP